MTIAEGDRLTRIGERMKTAFQSDPEYAEGDKVIILYRGQTLRAVAIGGYRGGKREALADLLSEIDSVCARNGAELLIVTGGLKRFAADVIDKYWPKNDTAADGGAETPGRGEAIGTIGLLLAELDNAT
jgi:hypothetical protein